jgi:phage terminase large subunit-like protein
MDGWLLTLPATNEPRRSGCAVAEGGRRKVQTRRCPTTLPKSREENVAKPKRTRAPAKPFTLRHFRAWASDLILDTGQSWHPEAFFEAFVEDVFAGYPECWLIVPEENTKTTSVAGLCLYHMDHRAQAMVPIGASSREQAEIMYRQAEGFVLRSPRLHAVTDSAIALAKGKRKTEVPRYLCLEGHRRINHVDGGRLQVFPADDRTGDGIIPTLGAIDEPHRMRDLSLYRTWVGKVRKRQGQVVALSTSGEPGSDFETTRAKIRQSAPDVIREGCFLRAAGPRVVLHEWAVPEDGDVEDLALVKAANPFSGLTVEDLAAKLSSPTMTMSHWRRFVCNLPTRADAAAINEAEWAAAKGEAIPAGEPVWLGLDVAWKWDTTAAVPLWMPSPQRRILGVATVLVPPRDGTSLDPARVEKALLEIHDRNPVHTVVMDTSRAEQLGRWIETSIGATVIDRQQTIPLAIEDYDRFMEALRQGWLKHQGDADLTAHALNAIARQLPRGDAVFDRPVQSRRAAALQQVRVIDALTAAAMVHALAVQPAEEDVVTFAHF